MSRRRPCDCPNCGGPALVVARGTPAPSARSRWFVRAVAVLVDRR